MMRYSVQPGDRLFVEGYRILSFAKNMSKNIGKNISITYVVKTAKNFLIMLNNLQQVHLKLLPKRVIQNTAEGAGALIGNKIANRIMKVSKISSQNNLETITNDEIIPE